MSDLKDFINDISNSDLPKEWKEGFNELALTIGKSNDEKEALETENNSMHEKNVLLGDRQFELEKENTELKDKVAELEKENNTLFLRVDDCLEETEKAYKFAYDNDDGSYKRMLSRILNIVRGKR